MGPLYHSPGVQSYCTPTDNLSLAGHYTDMRNSASWYGSTANDPRFASEYPFYCLYLTFCGCVTGKIADIWSKMPRQSFYSVIWKCYAVNLNFLYRLNG
jgi:hypothetical protein